MQRRFFNTQATVPADYILCYDFDNNTTDKSVNALHGIQSGTTTFENGLEGKKCIRFNNGCVFTPSSLPINSNVVSISFYAKTTQTTAGIICELSTNYNSNNAFIASINDRAALSLTGASHDAAGYNMSNSNAVLPTDWAHFIVQIDRNKSGNNQVKIYMNNIDVTLVTSTIVNLTNNFSNQVLYIGRRNPSTAPYVGYLQMFKVYNRALSPAEILGLSKELNINI